MHIVVFVFILLGCSWNVNFLWDCWVPLWLRWGLVLCYINAMRAGSSAGWMYSCAVNSGGADLCYQRTIPCISLVTNHTRETSSANDCIKDLEGRDKWSQCCMASNLQSVLWPAGGDLTGFFYHLLCDWGEDTLSLHLCTTDKCNNWVPGWFKVLLEEGDIHPGLESSRPSVFSVHHSCFCSLINYFTGFTEQIFFLKPWLLSIIVVPS